MPVSKRTRFEVLRRDGNACRYCGAMAPDVKIQVDHVIPVALGGTDEASNLVAACRDCNTGKASTAASEELVAEVAQRDLDFADALRQAAAEMVTAPDPDEPGEVYAAAFDEAWSAYKTPAGEVDRPRQWRASVKAFHRSGLPVDVLASAVEIAMNKPGLPNDAVFRYTCGIAWRRVKEMQDRAAEIMAARALESHAPCDICRRDVSTDLIIRDGVDAGACVECAQVAEPGAI